MFHEPMSVFPEALTEMGSWKENTGTKSPRRYSPRAKNPGTDDDGD